MELIEYAEQFRQKIIGHTIAYTRLAANSLILYVDCQPGDEIGLIIWLEPTWHVKGPTGVLVGSRQAQMDDAPDDRDAFVRVAEPLSTLHNKKIVSMDIEPLTHDLHLLLEGGFWIKTFVADPTDDESWYIRDATSRMKLVGSPRKLDIRQSKT